MKVITVCGSMKYKKEMMEITEKMALEGNCVITPIYLTRPSKEDYTTENFATLAKVHYEKIKNSDAILVVNVDNYIGESTSKEIEYARSLNKEILYYTDLT
ncbi:MAG: hypothetical protein IKJ32_05575 [Clostridia bacterium]|nr:hypothetical protein [Clostridia bacterium]